jgi:hypothetical protein
MPDHHNVQFALRTATGTELVPVQPADIPSNAYAIWPVNMDLNGTLLKSATVQPLCRLDGPIPCYVFFETPGVVPQVSTNVTGIPDANTSSLLTFQAPDGRASKMLIVPAEAAWHAWKANLQGADRLLISPANVIPDGSTLHLQSDDSKKLHVWIYPPLSRPPTIDGNTAQPVFDRFSTEYSATVPAKTVSVSVIQTQAASLARPMKIGFRKKPVPPEDSDFNSAAVWQIRISPDALDGVENVLLRISYAGDVARAYIGDRLIDDDFYYGRPWEMGLKRFAPDVFDKGITLKILPTPKDSPIYIQDDHKPRLTASETEAAFHGADLLKVEPEIIYEVKMECQ